jgi:predicted histidine transporter YuiF (NhaC family)
MPAAIAHPFSQAMQQAMWLPAAAYLIGLVAVLFYERPKHAGFGGSALPAPAAAEH